MAKDSFTRSEGELVTTKEDHNYNVEKERGDDGEVKVEGQDRYLWPTELGSWNDKGEFPNEEAAKEFIEKDSEEKEEAKTEAKEGDSTDDRAEESSSAEESSADDGDQDGDSDKEESDSDKD